MRTFEITASSHTVQAKAGARAEVRFTITSRSDQAMVGRVAVRLGDETDPAWVTVHPDRVRFSAEATEGVTLVFEPPDAAADSEHEIKLVVANEENPDDDWTESAPVTFHVRPVQEGRPFPWWAVAVGAAVLIVGVGAYATYRLMQRPGFGEPCEPGGCAPGLVCTEEPDDGAICLGGRGFTCSSQDDCGHHLSCADEGGERPAEQDIATTLGFAQTRRPTASEPDFACRVPQPLWRCEDELECATSQSCVAADGAKLCSLNDGERCRVDAQCASTWCKGGTCTEYTGQCERGADCRENEQCEDGRCVLPLGHACTSNDRCASGNCEDGVCKEAPADPPTNPCRGVRCRPPSVCLNGRCVVIDVFIQDERRRLLIEELGRHPERP
jgi:hypothetical protein